MGISSPKKWRKKTRFFCRTLAIAWIAVIFTPLTLAAQEQKVSINVEQADISLVFQQIKEQTGLNFMYNTEQLKGLSPVTLHVANGTVEEALKKLFAGQPFEWQYDDNYIIIKKKEAKGEEIKAVQVRGIVRDPKHQPLPGVTVLVQEDEVGVTIGTATDVDGHYALTVPVLGDEAFSLAFSFVGFETQVVKYAGKETINVVLKEDIQEMNEVVVTGYGNVSKGNYTGAATTVKAEDIMMAGVSSIDQMLQGVVPGMLVQNQTGMVGATPKIRVRGTSTLLGSQEPLWVVDGVIQRDPQPFNSDDNFKFSTDADDITELAGNAISWLNPRDIESITVLKDASATAIYGSQAANGVIVITTKKAQVGRIQLSYSGDFTIGQRPRYGLYDLMNSAEHMQFQREIHEERKQYQSSSFILPMGYYGLEQKLFNGEITLEEMNKEYERMARTNTDWFDILFRNTFNHSHHLGISGGSEKIQNRISLGYSQENGEARGNSSTNFTASSNTSLQLWDKVQVSFLLNASLREVKGFAYGVDPFNYAYNTSRAIPAYNEDGSLYYHEKKGSASYVTGGTIYNYNILNEMDNTASENRTRTWGTTLDVQWEFLKGLTYQGMFSFSSSSADTKQWADEPSFYISSIRGYEYGEYSANSEEAGCSPLPMGGLLETTLTNTQGISVRNSLVYDCSIKDVHRLVLQLGIETNSTKTKGETNTRYGYMPTRGESFVLPPAEHESTYGMTMDNSDIVNGSHTVVNRVENQLSEYGSAVYTYDDRYVLNFSARVDASNRFGQDKNKRFQPTWSAGFKWRVASEPFWAATWWLNNLDIYGSYGYQGNAVTSVSPNLIATESYLKQYGDYGLAIKFLPYPNLGWEKTKTWNFGLDASFLKGRLNFTFNYFRKTSYVLSSRNIPFENGMENGVVSGSTMKNNGYDFVINLVPVRTKDFTWQLSLNTSVTNNTVDKNERINTLDDYLNGSAVVDGRPYSTFYSYEFAGLDDETGMPTFKHMDIEYENADSPKDFLVETGKFTPDFSGGLNMMFKYKQLSLSALFAVQWGGHNRLPNLYPAESGSGNGSGLPRPEQNVSRKLMNRWRQPGDQTIYPTLPSYTQDEEIYLPETKTSTEQRENCYAMYNLSDIRVANTDFIRCRSLSLSYDFTGEWLDKAGLGYLSLSASMSNPFMWVSDKKWDGLDPETGDWPTRRTTSLSLQIMF